MLLDGDYKFMQHMLHDWLLMQGKQEAHNGSTSDEPIMGTTVSVRELHLPEITKGQLPGRPGHRTGKEGRNHRKKKNLHVVLFNT